MEVTQRTPWFPRPGRAAGSSTGLAVVAALLGWLVTSSLAANLPDDFEEEVVVAGFNSPVSFRFLPDGRVLVAEQNTRRVRLALERVCHQGATLAGKA